MRVLFYNGSLRLGGAEKILLEILKGLKKDDKNIELLIADEVINENFYAEDIPKEVKLNYLIPDNIIKKTKYNRDRKKKLLNKILYNYFMLKEQWIKKQNIKKNTKGKKYDVVVDFDMGLSKNIDLIDSKLKIAWIHSAIDKWYKKEKKIERLGKRLEKYDILVTICDEMKERTDQLYPFLKNKIVKIYNPFDIEEILKKSKDEVSDEKKSYLLNGEYLLAVGRLDNYSKDYLTLLKGYKISLEKGIKEKLYILGDGPERDLIEGWIDELKLKDNVVLLGKDKNPYPWIKNAKVFLHSSRFEGLPTVLIEALICETPIISSDCPTGPKEILANGNYGLLFEVGDYNQLGEKICFLINNREEYQKYKKLSLVRREEFSKEKSLKKIEKILKGEINAI